MILNTLRVTRRRTRHSRGISKPQRALQNRASAAFFFVKYPLFFPSIFAVLNSPGASNYHDDGRREAWGPPPSCSGEAPALRMERVMKTVRKLLIWEKHRGNTEEIWRTGLTACPLIINKENKQSDTHADKINPDINSSSFCRASMKEKTALKSHNMVCFNVSSYGKNNRWLKIEFVISPQLK